MNSYKTTDDLSETNSIYFLYKALAIVVKNKKSIFIILVKVIRQIDLTGELLINVRAYSQEEERQHTQPKGRKTTHTASRKEDNTMKRQRMDETKYI